MLPDWQWQIHGGGNWALILKRAKYRYCAWAPDDIYKAVTTFRKICQIAAEDGAVFDPDTVKGSRR
jgi:hypothetical protein